MPYKQRLDREFEPELFLASAIFKDVPIPGFPFLYHRNYGTLLRAVRDFYSSLTPEILNALRANCFREKVLSVVSTLPKRELQTVISLRYGLQDGTVYTLEEVGRSIPRMMTISSRGRTYQLGEPVTRERVREREAKALRILRHPTRSKELSYLLNSLGKNNQN